ncbi:MAG: oxidoreductase [Deltaproteobacteria bacterium]|jgi:NAD(P)-dependent dehydrogenase (short-subunit alcohol dehydrogenase family)|nr:oxidoreductase [Deltaproteobacteria bacterium]
MSGGRLEGKVALITGAGQGIGKGIARRFAREGARVAIAEWNAESGATVATELEELGGEAMFVKTDVGVKAQVDAAVRATVDCFGSVDVLVNNAWSGPPMGRVEWKTTEEMEQALRVGFLSNFWSMQAVFPIMKARGWGRIVNMCSLNGVNAHMFSVPYNAAKEAVRSLTRTAAREWARHGIVCNVICPAAATEAYAAVMKANPRMEEDLLASHPMGRMGDPEEDIGAAALFLASEDCRYVTGNTLFVDGGSHINGSAWAPELPDEMPGRG